LIESALVAVSTLAEALEQVCVSYEAEMVAEAERRYKDKGKASGSCGS
jgi:hypothetical protein